MLKYYENKKASNIILFHIIFLKKSYIKVLNMSCYVLNDCFVLLFKNSVMYYAFISYSRRVFNIFREKVIISHGANMMFLLSY